MQRFRALPIFLLALLISISTLSARAQFSISIRVGFAPPPMVVYEQPICPEPNLMWTPGYWGYDNDGGYYWVPGAWVPAPYEGALWTPPYWGWENGQYAFYNGYWGRNVGYYGGVDYGYGYGGIGFSGGEWRGNNFAYNTAIMRVNERNIHNTYINRTIVQQNTLRNPNHASYNGGPGGINHKASANEQRFSRESHIAPTSYQSQHINTARADKASFAKTNGGHPTRVVDSKPLPAQRIAPPAGMNTAAQPGAHQTPRATPQPQIPQKGAPAQHSTPAQKQPGVTTTHTPPVQHSMPAQPQRNSSAPLQPHAAPAQQQHAAPQQQQRPAPQQQQRPAPQQQQRPAPQQQQRPAPQQQQRPAPQQQQRPAPQQQQRPAPQQQQRPAPQQQQRPAPQQQQRPAPQQQQRPAQQQQRPAPQQHSAPAPQQHNAPEPKK